MITNYSHDKHISLKDIYTIVQSLRHEFESGDPNSERLNRSIIPRNVDIFYGIKTEVLATFLSVITK